MARTVTHRLSCLTTTLDRIFLSEVTMAAHVSSAEDSMASTVKPRVERRRVLAARRAQSMVAIRIYKAK